MATMYARIFGFVERESLVLYSTLGYWALVAVPVLFLLSWFLVDRYAPFANGSGIPQLMAAAELSQEKVQSPFIESLLGIRIIIIKVFSSLLAVLGGGAIGREGPTLQMAGSIFHLAGKYLPTKYFSRNHHELILAGGAAGLASAFNTPLGGIVFVVEELSKSHMSSFRTGILHAIIIAGLVSQLIMGPYLYMGYPKIEFFQMSEVGIVIAVSIIVGIVAALFGQALKLLVIYRSRFKTKSKSIYVALASGLIFAAYAIYVSKVGLGSGKELLNGLIYDDKHASILDIVSRFFGSVVTYAVGGAGGIFAPTLSLGGATASFFTNLFGSAMGPLAVLIGMTAALSALTQSPFTAFVLILEMTDRHSAIFPLMIAALIGQGVSKFVTKKSFYDFVCVRLLEAHSEEHKNHPVK